MLIEFEGPLEIAQPDPPLHTEMVSADKRFITACDEK
jgi:hypothetical protein